MCCIFVLFLIVQLEYCMLEDSSTNYEMHDMYICVRGARGQNLVGRDHIGMELLTTSSQPMRKLDSGNLANRKVLSCYVYCRRYHGKQTPEFHWVTTRGYIRVVVCPLSIRVRDRNSSFCLKFCQKARSW